MRPGTTIEPAGKGLASDRDRRIVLPLRHDILPLIRGLRPGAFLPAQPLSKPIGPAGDQIGTLISALRSWKRETTLRSIPWISLL
jgi:hypothetical protein